jgi:hypothetical protein
MGTIELGMGKLQKTAKELEGMLRSALQKQHGTIIDDLNIRVFRTKADLPDWNAEIVGGERVVETTSRTLLKEPASNCSGNLNWPTERQRRSKSEASHADG